MVCTVPFFMYPQLPILQTICYWLQIFTPLLNNTRAKELLNSPQKFPFCYKFILFKSNILKACAFRTFRWFIFFLDGFPAFMCKSQIRYGIFNLRVHLAIYKHIHWSWGFWQISINVSLMCIFIHTRILSDFSSPLISVSTRTSLAYKVKHVVKSL